MKARLALPKMFLADGCTPMSSVLGSLNVKIRRVTCGAERVCHHMSRLDGQHTSQQCW